MTTTTNFGLPIYGNSDKPKWTDTNEAFQDLDSKVADKTGDNSFTGANTFGGQVTHNADLLMKGGSTVESDDGVITPTAPSSDKTGTDVIQINDSAGNPLYRVRPIQHSNGKVDLDIAGQPAANGGVLTFNGESIASEHVYSTDEQVVGKWIDGRHVYEKTFNGSLSNFSSEHNVAHGISNMLDVVDLFAICRGCVDGHQRPLPFAYYAMSSWDGAVSVSTTDILFQLGRDFLSEYHSGSYYVTIRYTKTTG